jgi:dTDP-4-dehydrorhamnose 3,5-epimerase
MFSPADLADCLGRRFDIAQVNQSTSSRGVIRGIHSRVRHEAEAKMVTCVSGEILDVVVDLRRESPTFGQWRGAWLNARASRVLVVEEGLGHAFYAASETAIVVYATTRIYNPQLEISVYPKDPEIGIQWPEDAAHILSPRDLQAPTLADAQL